MYFLESPATTLAAVCKVSRPTTERPVLVCNEVQPIHVGSFFSFHLVKKIFLKLMTFCPIFRLLHSQKA